MKPPKDPGLSDAAGESAPVPEFWSKQPVVAEKRPHGDRREVRGESCRTVCGQGVEAEFQSQWPWQRAVLETSTAAETVLRRKGTRIALYLEPDRFDLQFSTQELTHDVQTPNMLSTLRLRRFAWYLVGGADLSLFFTYSDEPSTISVRADVDWGGDAMTCKSTSARVVQLESHQIEAWSAIQQVSFSSAESEAYAIEASKVDRWEAAGIIA